MKRIAAVLIALLVAIPFMAFGASGDEIFAQLDGIVFSFSSGAGGWSTEVALYEDGSFTGYFHDSDMGDSGDGYPDGTLYECSFSGQFVLIEQIDPYTYAIRLDALVPEGEIGEERIVDGVRVINEGAYGIEGGDVFMLYCPGRETADLPEEYLEWISMSAAWGDMPETLSFYGLYNVEEALGFSSYPAFDAEGC